MVLGAKDIVAIALVMYFSKYVSWHLVFCSFSLSSFGARVGPIFRIFVAKALVVKYVRVFAFEVLARAPLMCRIKVLVFQVFILKAIKLFKVSGKKMFDAALRFLGVDR